mgnify:CR=1 FL=1
MKFEVPRIAIIGLGYVGLPLAIEFSRKFKVIGYDIDEKRVNELHNGYDRTNETKKEDFFASKDLIFSSSASILSKANIYIVTVPTPVDKNNNPDLRLLISATETVGRCLNKNDIVIFESTVYPGCTEQVCVPILEKKSSLKFNIEFFCGYSPERINPGDKEHTLTNICKITSGSTPIVTDYIDSIYSSIIEGGTYKASSIMVAEAAKVIENTQRDVNIALVNELSLIFKKLNLDTSEVLEAASTKWNFLPFKPGLVGGHCIGVDPYYLTHKAAELGYHPEIILAGRRINDKMGDFIAENTISELALQGVNPVGAKIAILGLTFKENCPDLRNTKTITILEKLKQYKCNVSVVDDWADASDIKNLFKIEPKKLENIRNYNAVIIAVGHDQYKTFKENDWLKMLNPDGVLIDVKSVYRKELFLNSKIRHWRL